MRRIGIASVVVALVTGSSLMLATPASASTTVCAEPTYVYTFTSVATSSRPTNLRSAYITGPGTITYNATTTATVGASMTASVSAEASVVFAKASTSIGVGVTASRAWTSGFSYALQVASGQRRAMVLYQQSRSFYVSKSRLASPCNYVAVYSNNAANAPRTARYDEWKLVA